MYENNNKLTIFDVLIFVGALWYALKKLGFDLWSDWLRYKWITLCEAVNAFGVMLYNFLEWLLKVLLIVGVSGGLFYLAFLGCKLIYNVTWKRLDRHDRNIESLLYTQEALKEQVNDLMVELSALRSDHASAIRSLIKVTKELEDYTGLAAQKEAEKLAQAFENQQKALKAQTEREENRRGAL